METKELVELLNDDLETEFQSIVQYVRHVATISGAEFTSTVDELKVHLGQELQHATALAEQVSFLGGEPSTPGCPTSPPPPTPGAHWKPTSRLETRQLERYRERVQQATELGLADVAEALRPLLTQTQEHVRATSPPRWAGSSAPQAPVRARTSRHRSSSRNAMHRRDDGVARGHDVVGLDGRRRPGQAVEPVLEVLTPALDEPVGVEEQRRTDRERDGGAVGVRSRSRTRAGDRRPGRGTGARRVEQERWQVARRGQLEGVGSVSRSPTGRDDLVAALQVVEEVVESSYDGRGIGILARERAGGVPHLGHRATGEDTVTADVADADEHPAIADRERVVPVAADVVLALRPRCTDRRSGTR